MLTYVTLIIDIVSSFIIDPTLLESTIIDLLITFKDVFNWSYAKLKGVTPELISTSAYNLMEGVKLERQYPRPMNLHYAQW